MASLFSHAVAAMAIAPVVLPLPISPRVLAVGALAASLPDADVAGFSFGIAYGDLLGHRGLTHSLAFAALLGLALVPLAGTSPPQSRPRLWLYLMLAVASHGILDAFTNGGLGIAFFAPFTAERYFFPARPIEVSPIGAGAFFSEWGRRVLRSEARWIWLPSLIVAGTALLSRRALSMRGVVQLESRHQSPRDTIRGRE